MTDIDTHSEAETRLVGERIGQLLTKFGHDGPNLTELWGAQFDLGLAWVHFPVGHGGLGVAPGLQKLVNDRLGQAGVHSPMMQNFMGIGMAAPVIVTHGSEDQRRRYLRRAFTCEDIWCQLFSEPGAGSDVANASTTAVRDGDEWIVNGQKVWTSSAHVSSYGLLLCRTDASVPKHRGLSYFVIDMRQPGVEVRPIRQIDEGTHFNEVFFTDARVSDDERLGGTGDGWRVAVTTLMNERVAIGGRTGAPAGSGPIAHAVDLWRQHGLNAPERRDELMKLWCRAEVARLLAIRAENARKIGNPGPEGSVGKLITAELSQDIAEFAVTLMGPTGMLRSDAGRVDARTDILTTRQATIPGGTSEVMRNILGERVLGLPGDVRVDKEIPWNQTLRG